MKAFVMNYSRRKFILRLMAGIAGICTMSAADLAHANGAVADSKGNTPAKEPISIFDTGFDGLGIVEHDFKFSETLNLRQETNRIVVHHTGTETDRDMSAEEIHLLHRDSFKWAGIGYHYVIRKNGTIERGRYWNTVGAHAGGNNKDSVGISLAGNFEVAAPTARQIESLIKLLAALCSVYGLMPMEGTILGHRDVNATDCPGAFLYAMLPQIRHRVYKEMLGDAIEIEAFQEEDFE